jgi:Family of unknown function (DUF5752)
LDSKHCSDASIFHHTFQTLSIHHFLTEGFSNDFAQWVLAVVNRDALAEQLAALDMRDFCQQHPEFAKQSALEPFYFCESLEVTLPTGRTARTLDEFREGISPFSHSGFYFHYISSRLRLQLLTNDFSQGSRMASAS